MKIIIKFFYQNAYLNRYFRKFYKIIIKNNIIYSKNILTIRKSVLLRIVKKYTLLQKFLFFTCLSPALFYKNFLA